MSIAVSVRSSRDQHARVQSDVQVYRGSRLAVKRLSCRSFVCDGRLRINVCAASNGRWSFTVSCFCVREIRVMRVNVARIARVEKNRFSAIRAIDVYGGLSGRGNVSHQCTPRSRVGLLRARSSSSGDSANVDGASENDPPIGV
eukprot:3840287-Pleurochrysis_carterae.AAC.1